MAKDNSNGNNFESYAKQQILIASENLGSSKFFVVKHFKSELEYFLLVLYDIYRNISLVII